MTLVIVERNRKLFIFDNHAKKKEPGLMSLLVYLSKLNGTAKRIRDMVDVLDWKGPVELFYSFKQFEVRLRVPTGEEDVGLLFFSTPESLNEVIHSRSLVSNLRLIVILPDRETETVAQGHLLRPRFLTYRDTDFSDVAMVLQKMGKKFQADKNGIS